MGKADTLTNLLLHDIAKKYNNQCSFNSKMVFNSFRYQLLNNTKNNIYTG